LVVVMTARFPNSDAIEKCKAHCLIGALFDHITTDEAFQWIAAFDRQYDRIVVPTRRPRCPTKH